MDHLGSEEDNSTHSDVASLGLWADVRLQERIRPKPGTLADAYNRSAHTADANAGGVP